MFSVSFICLSCGQIAARRLTLRLSLLVREFARLSGRTMDVSIGRTLPWAELEPLRDRKVLLDELKRAVFELRRCPAQATHQSAAQAARAGGRGGLTGTKLFLRKARCRCQAAAGLCCYCAFIIGGAFHLPSSASSFGQ
jgi:hypothetical protein